MNQSRLITITAASRFLSIAMFANVSYDARAGGGSSGDSPTTAPAQVVAPARDAAPPASMPSMQMRVLSLVTIGDTARTPLTRYVNLAYFRQGWTGYVRGYISPQVRWGVRRFVLHCPFGRGPKLEMDCDGILHAREMKLNWLTDDFVEAFKPLTSQGIEVCAYIGSPINDPDFDAALKAGGEIAWEQRWRASIQPILDAGMSIAIDASVSDPADGRLFKACCKLRDAGVRVYCEGFPMLQQPHWASFNVMSVSENLAQSQKDGWGVPLSQIKGEIVEIRAMPPVGMSWNDRGWEAPVMRATLDRGLSVAGPVARLLEERVPPRALFEPRR